MAPEDDAAIDATRRQEDRLARLQNDLKNHRLVIVTGAGVTLNVTADETGKPLSRITWTGLIRNGLDYLVSEGHVDKSNRRTKKAYADLEVPDAEGLLDAASVLSSQMKLHGQYPTWLESVFGNLSQEIRHPALLDVIKALHDRGATLLTTNYDDILEKHCGIPRVGRLDKNEILRFRGGDVRGVFHIHGSYHNSEEVVLDTTNYYEVMHSDDVQDLLRAYLQDKTILFIGCGSGLEDPNFSALLKWASERHKTLPHRHCLLIRDDDTIMCQPLIRVKYGSRYQDLVEYLTKLLGDQKMTQGLDTHAVKRSLEHFYIGGLFDISENIRMKEQSKMMRWLSSTNFWGKQFDLLERAQTGTGGWIFDDERFKSWLGGSTQPLWCHGDAGAGKTILSAIIIDHLCSTLMTKHTGLAWLYIDYREQDLHSIETLFTNILVQLFKQRGEISNSMMKSLGLNWEGAKPTPAEYKSWLQEEIQKFGRTIIIIDALDEMRTTELCKQLINELQSLTPPISLLVTSRSQHELPFLRGVSIEIEVKPRKGDVILYIESRLEHSQQLGNHVQADPSIKDLAIKMLSGANDRMFLKAELILNVLEHLPTATEVKDALNSLPPTYDSCYEFTLKQIKRKDPIQHALAFKVLAWLSHALGVLTVKALQEALAVEAGDEKIDEEKQIPVEDLIAACSGLVVTYTIGGTQHIRLLHETARMYLKNIRLGTLPPGPEIILNACLAYLSLPKFSDLCFFKMSVDKRIKQHAFYEYAASYWFGHAVQGNLELTSRDLIVNYLESNQRYSADEFLLSVRPSAWGCDKGTPWTDWTKHSISRSDTPLHAAATYGLRLTVRWLIKKKGYEKDQRNNFGETSLHRAAQVGRTGTMEELIAHGADLGAKVPHHYLNDAASLILAAICLQAEAIRVLLNHGVNVNTFDPKYMTCSLHLAASMDTKLTRLLLDRGAFVDFPGKSPHFPETWPMTSLHFAVFHAHVYQGAHDRVKLLLERGAKINAQSSTGNTALHMAILAGHKDLTLLLLQKGTSISLQNKKGKSVIQLARERGLSHWVEEGISEISRNFPTAPPLHTAIWSKNCSLVYELLETGHDIAEEDNNKVTPWEYCIRSSNIEIAEILVDHMKRQKSLDHVGNAAFEIALSHMTTFDYTDRQSWEKTVMICNMLLPFRRITDPTLEFAKIESPICNYKKTFLIWAAEQGRISEVEFFLRCGSDVNATDTFGTTGLIYAVNTTNVDVDMVKLLIEKGSNLTHANHEGITPLIAAEKNGNIPIRELLEGELLRRSKNV